MHLFLIRHAQSANNHLATNASYDDYIATRSHDPVITELGVRQAQLLAHHLASDVSDETGRGEDVALRTGYGVTRLFCSPMHRALQTTLPLSVAVNIAPEVWIDVHEHGGIFTGNPRTGDKLQGYPGLSRSAMETRFPGYLLPGGVTEDGWWQGVYEEEEECRHRAARVAEQLRMLAEQEPEGRIGIVTHGTFMDRLLKALIAPNDNQMIFFMHYNTAITRLEIVLEGYVALRYLNRVAHLPMDMVSR